MSMAERAAAAASKVQRLSAPSLALQVVSCNLAPHPWKQLGATHPTVAPAQRPLEPKVIRKGLGAIAQGLLTRCS